MGYDDVDDDSEAKDEVITKALDEEEIKKLFQEFVSMDIDGDGYITKDEFFQAWQKAGQEPLPSEWLNAVFTAAASNNDGKISWEEFVKFY